MKLRKDGAPEVRGWGKKKQEKAGRLAPAAHVKSQSPHSVETPAARVIHLNHRACAARVIHLNRRAHAARVIHFNRHAIAQALAPEIFHLNDHPAQQPLAARVFRLNRRDLAPGFFHLNHLVNGQTMPPRSHLQRSEAKLTQSAGRGLLNTAHCVGMAAEV
jgi:hypothetical protein